MKLLFYRTLNALRVQRACKLAELLAIFFPDLISECQCIQRVMSTYSKSDVKISTSDVSLSIFFFFVVTTFISQTSIDDCCE
jgi:hypothetical protein